MVCRGATLSGGGLKTGVWAVMLREAGVDFNVLTVLSAQLARHPKKVFKFLRREKIDYVQFIPCLAGFDGEGEV